MFNIRMVVILGRNFVGLDFFSIVLSFKFFKIDDRSIQENLDEEICNVYYLFVCQLFQGEILLDWILSSTFSFLDYAFLLTFRWCRKYLDVEICRKCSIRNYFYISGNCFLFWISIFLQNFSSRNHICINCVQRFIHRDGRNYGLTLVCRYRNLFIIRYSTTTIQFRAYERLFPQIVFYF